MSVDISIRFKNGDREYVPLDSAARFEEYWRKPSEYLDLQIIPIMDSLATSEKSIAKQLLQELRQLRQYTASNNEIDQSIVLHLFKRIDAAIKLLEDSLDSWEDVEYFTCG